MEVETPEGDWLFEVLWPEVVQAFSAARAIHIINNGVINFMLGGVALVKVECLVTRLNL